MDELSIRYEDDIALLVTLAHRPVFLLLLLAVAALSTLGLAWRLGRHIDRSGGPPR